MLELLSERRNGAAGSKRFRRSVVRATASMTSHACSEHASTTLRFKFKRRVPPTPDPGARMDIAALNQHLAGIALAFSAGLLHRADPPAPHFHFPPAACRGEGGAETSAGWPTWAVVGLIFVAYCLGGFFPPRRLLRACLRRLHGLRPAPPAAEEPHPRLHPEGPALARRRPRALFDD